eukprot:Em0003g1483a
MVQCTTNGEVKRYYYKNEGNGGKHAEAMFIEDFLPRKLPPDSQLGLYMNWMPCVKCCEELYNLKKKLTIYAVAPYKVKVSATSEKLRLLKSDRISIHPLGKDQFFQLFLDTQRGTVESKLQIYSDVIQVRDRITAGYIRKIEPNMF